MADGSTITNTDEDQDSDEIENMNNFFEDYESANESISTYESGIKPRINLIRQLRATGLSGSNVLKRMYQTKFSNVKLADCSQLNSINRTRKREKDDLVRLNDNLAKYIQTTRFLELENKKLLIQIEIIENTIQQNSSSIKNIYEVEITEANKVIDQLLKENVIDTNNIQQINNHIQNEQILSEEINQLHQVNQNQIDSIRKTISENDAKIILFRRRLSDIEDEIYRYKIESNRIISEIKCLQTNIENEIFLKIIFQTEKISLEDQITSILLRHEAEMNELRSKYFSIDLDPSIHFRNELSQTIKQLRQQYDQNIQHEKDSLHNQYIISFNQLIINQQQVDFDFIRINRDNQQQNKLHQQILQCKNRNIHLKENNNQLANQINQIQTLINHLQEKNNQKSDEQLTEIEQTRRRLDQLDLNYHQITTIKISLEKEINTYRQLLEGRNGLQVHIDRILRGINRSRETPYLKILRKNKLQLKQIKDLSCVIFIDASGSTSDQLETIEKSILEAELSICDMIEFDKIVIWSTTALICDNLSMVKSNGITNPSSIFENNSTKDLFNKCDIIVFVTDGQIEHKNVTKFSSKIKNNLNKILIICIIIQENVEDRSSINISVIAPLLLASNVLCLLFNGQTFSVILSKGSISSFYPISENPIDFKEIFNQVEIYDNSSIPDGFLILNDDLNECIALDFEKFLRLLDLNEMILINENEWKIIIQYGKINNRLDEIKFFVSTMKIYSNYSDLNQILKQFDQQYLNQQKIIQNKIFILKQNNFIENNQQIIKLEKQLDQLFNQIKQDKINYINQNLHLTPEYWNHILDLIYQQQISSYLIKHFRFH